MDNRFFDDAEDGYDSLTWISRQPWCDGNIGMYGSLYYGATQWLVAPEQHPNLKAIVPQNINPDPWQRMYRDHGAVQLAHTAQRIYDYDDEGREKVERCGWWNWHRRLPLIGLDTVCWDASEQALERLYYPFHLRRFLEGDRCLGQTAQGPDSRVSDERVVR